MQPQPLAGAGSFACAAGEDVGAGRVGVFFLDAVSAALTGAYSSSTHLRVRERAAPFLDVTATARLEAPRRGRDGPRWPPPCRPRRATATSERQRREAHGARVSPGASA